MWSLLAGVLHVGNVRFTGDDAAAISEPEVAALACRRYAYPAYPPPSPHQLTHPPYPPYPPTHFTHPPYPPNLATSTHPPPTLPSHPPCRLLQADVSGALTHRSMTVGSETTLVPLTLALALALA